MDSSNPGNERTDNCQRKQFRLALGGMSIGEWEADIKISIFCTNDGRRRKEKNRKEKVTRTRLGIRHSNTENAIVGKHPIGLCEYCRDPEATEHELLVCREYTKEKKNDDGWIKESGNGRGRK